MTEIIHPANQMAGAIRLPGDKSISHRWAMIAALAEGKTTIHGYATGEDCHSTLGILKELGIEVEDGGSEVSIVGKGLDGLSAPKQMLDAGNSGSTIRMMSGILAGQSFTSRIAGDESLAKRPMQRVMKPLAEMGAEIIATDEKFPPLEIRGAKLKAIDYSTPVASAQVKTCVLFAGLFCEGETIVREPVKTRDHTELALRMFGADIVSAGKVVTLQGRPRLAAKELTVPGDLSSSAFFLSAALMIPGSNLVIGGVGLNPTRTALLDYLVSLGAEIKILNVGDQCGELVGDILVRGTIQKRGEISGALTASLIDEIPTLAVLGAATEGLDVRDASELRIKETDRIATVADNFKRAGLEIEVRPDGFTVPGRQKFHAAHFDSFGDHRIAMAFAVAALVADGPCQIENAEAASVSFPEFYSTLRSLTS
ncbi:3-phosphoshikimate 1-carboxyvinyltransferase [Bryobacter aggregatus]|uniref:3-phosphoshikimate 1-carboxyvinyltransferase n=1 Tax=Bryobacter aggregatus TaxID=360054 RepID=UPI0004E15E6B|nr:3-phosphoshikimate 1-carboxyvinyltransferase [Bryobacter aggregatus]